MNLHFKINREDHNLQFCWGKFELKFEKKKNWMKMLVRLQCNCAQENTLAVVVLIIWLWSLQTCCFPWEIYNTNLPISRIYPHKLRPLPLPLNYRSLDLLTLMHCLIYAAQAESKVSLVQDHCEAILKVMQSLTLDLFNGLTADCEILGHKSGLQAWFDTIP